MVSLLTLWKLPDVKFLVLNRLSNWGNVSSLPFTFDWRLSKHFSATISNIDQAGIEPTSRILASWRTTFTIISLTWINTHLQIPTEHNLLLFHLQLVLKHNVENYFLLIQLDSEIQNHRLLSLGGIQAILGNFWRRQFSQSGFLQKQKHQIVAVHCESATMATPKYHR